MSFWSDQIRRLFVPELTRYTDYFLDRVLPPLEDLDEKADAIERAEAEFLRLESFEPLDESRVQAQADLAAELYFARSSSLRHTVVGLFVVGLYHLVEQQLGRIHSDLTRFNPSPFALESTLKEIATASGVRPAEVTAWQTLMELKAVANVVKHAEGSAAVKLRNVRPDLFQHPAIKGLAPADWMIEARVLRPLAGEDIYLEREDFERYANAVRAFWDGLAEAFAARRF